MNTYDDVETRWQMQQGILYYSTASQQIRDFMPNAVKASIKVTQRNLNTLRTFNEELRAYNKYDFVLMIPWFTQSTGDIHKRLCTVRKECIALCNQELNKLEEGFRTLKKIWRIDETIAKTVSEYYPYNLSFTVQLPCAWPDIKDELLKLRTSLQISKSNLEEMEKEIENMNVYAPKEDVEKLKGLVEVHRKKIVARDQFLKIMGKKRDAWELAQLATEATSALYSTKLADDLLRCQECGIRCKQVAFGCGHMMCQQCGEFRGGQCPYCGQTIYHMTFLKFSNVASEED